MKFRKTLISIFSLGGITAAIFFPITGQSSEAAGPKVVTTYSIYSPSQPMRFQIPSDQCGDWDPENNCIGYQTKEDPFGPAIRTVGITFKNRVTGLQTGWSLCGSQDVMNSLKTYDENGLTQIPKMNWAKYGVYVGSGEGMGLHDNAFDESAGMTYLATNTSRITYQGWAIICSRDPKTPSGTVWKLIVGNQITLPPLNTF